MSIYFRDVEFKRPIDTIIKFGISKRTKAKLNVLIALFSAVIGYFYRELKFYRTIMGDSRTPKFSKIMLGTAIGYVIWPLGLIPDFIPIIGYLDDVIIAGTLVFIALKKVPGQVVLESRLKISKITDESLRIDEINNPYAKYVTFSQSIRIANTYLDYRLPLSELNARYQSS